MGKRGGAVCRSKRGRVRDRGSDGSDEDYVAGDDSAEDSNCSSLVPSEEDHGAGVETDVCDSFDDEETVFVASKPKQHKRKLPKEKSKPEASKRKSGASMAVHVDDDADSLACNGNVESNTDDEEFVPDDVDDDDDDEGEWEQQKVRFRSSLMAKKTPTKKIRKRKKSRVSKTTRKRRVRPCRKIISTDEDSDFVEEKAPKKVTKTKKGRKKKTDRDSDSDGGGSSTPGCDYSVSEEEREFLKEASTSLNLISARLRSSSSQSQNGVKVGGRLNLQQKVCYGVKDKLKISESHPDIGKQVCGICLTEERNRVVRGKLDCCAHYFCFTCIMEWSKVESRCPLCKQRFVTISKEGQSDVGVSLRKTVIKIPRRDQVYRPSEEEIMSFLNPYDSVVCIECHQGGDDELMLLCDICDSPAHTYCVGLGREVPEDNWYCEACKASHRASPVLPLQSLRDDSRNENTASNDFSDGRRRPVGDFDLNIPYERTTEASQEQNLARGSFFSPGNPVREALDAASPIASTVLGRRRLRFRIHNLLSSNMMTSISEVPDSSLASNITNGAERAGVGGTNNLSCRLDGGYRQADLPSCSLETGDLACSNSDRLRIEQSEDSVEPLSNGFNCGRLKTSDRVHLSDTVSGIDLRNRSNVNVISRHDPCVDAGRCNAPFNAEMKKQIQFLVKRHMEPISNDLNLGYNKFKEIARHSTHTVLAACGFDHQKSIIIPFDLPICAHFEIGDDRSSRIVKNCCSDCFSSFVKAAVLKTTAKVKGQWPAV